MSIIGIVASEKQTNQIRREIKQEMKGAQIEIVYISYRSIQNVANIKFDIVVIQNLPQKLQGIEKDLKIILQNAKCMLLNTDLKLNEEIFGDLKLKTLTYGLKNKATITASSIGEEKIIISIQRAFKNLKGSMIELQEIPKKLEKNNTKDIYNSLIKTAIINIYGTENA